MNKNLITAREAIDFFNACITKIEGAEDFEPKTVKITPLQDSPSDRQRAFIYGYVARLLLKQEHELGNEAFKHLNFKNPKDVAVYESYHRMISYFDIINDIKVPRSLSNVRGKKDEVRAYIETLLEYGDKLGINLALPDWTHLGLDK